MKSTVRAAESIVVYEELLCRIRNEDIQKHARESEERMMRSGLRKQVFVLIVRNRACHTGFARNVGSIRTEK